MSIARWFFSPANYPSTLGSAGLADVEFVRFTEWKWLKRCFWLFGFSFMTGAVGLYVGLEYPSQIKDGALWAYGLAWAYNGLLLFLIIVSSVLGMIKAFLIKTLANEGLQASQGAVRTAQMMRKGGL